MFVELFAKEVKSHDFLFNLVHTIIKLLVGKLVRANTKSTAAVTHCLLWGAAGKKVLSAVSSAPNN